MKKKLLSALLCTAMVIGLLAGCGSKQEAPAADAAEPAQTEEAAQPEAAPAETEDAAEAEDAAADESAAGDKIVIGLTDANMSNESNAIFSNAAIDYASKLDNVELIVNDGEGNAEKQIAQCESFVAQGVDVVIISPYDYDAAVTAAQLCVDAGIPVFVAKGLIADMSVVETYVGSDDFNAGVIEMEFIAEQLGGKGNIVIIEGPTGVTGAVLRNDGIKSVLEKYPDIEVLYSQPADWYRDKAMELMENWLQLGADINAVVAHNDEMALGAYDALEAAGIAAEVPVIGIDGIQAAVESVGEGKLKASILQDSKSIAEKAIDVAIQLANGETVEKEYDIPYQVITKENYTDFLN